MKLSKSYNAFGMAALGLALAFSFSACDNPTQVEGTVGISSQDGLDVTATPVMGGVLLEWNHVLDATSYRIYRVKAEDRDSDPAVQPKLVSNNNPTQTNKATGKTYFLDLRSDDNELVAGKEYIYTIVTSGNTKTDSKTEVTVETTGTIPPRNTQLTAPSGLKMDLEQNVGKITVSWDKPNFTTVVPARYNVYIGMDGNFNNGPSATVLPFETSATFDWPEGNQVEGEYQARVIASVSNNSYFKQSEPFNSNKAPFVSLFGDIGSFSVTSTNLYFDLYGNPTMFEVEISPSQSNRKGKTNATYTLERVKLDEKGNKSGIYMGAGTFDKDALGYLKTRTDSILVSASANGEYLYQVKATQEGSSETQIKKINAPVRLDKFEMGLPRMFASYTGTLRISSPTYDTTNPSSATKQIYTITANVSSFKGVLAATDKLVIYTSLSSSGSGYSQKLEFSKTELESGSTKDLSLSKISSTSYADYYLQAYIESSNGKRENVTEAFNNYTYSPGVSSMAGSGEDRYARLRN